MAYNEKLTTRVRALLAHLPDVEEKKMFRGVTFMVCQKMCVTVGDDRIMCRIDPSLHEEVTKKEGCRTVIMGGKQYIGYVYVKEEVVRTKSKLSYWISLALDFNVRAKKSKKVKS